MRRLVLTLLFIICGAPPASAQDGVAVDVTDLLEGGSDYVGLVTVTGELIGDYGFRSDAMWTQLNDDSYGLNPILDGGELTGGNVGVAVRIPLPVAADLDPPGGYRVRGPIVAATGEWIYHDTERGGESYIDVVTVELIEPGKELVEHPNPIVFLLGLVLVGAAAVSWRQTRERQH